MELENQEASGKFEKLELGKSEDDELKVVEHELQVDGKKQKNNSLSKMFRFKSDVKTGSEEAVKADDKLKKSSFFFTKKTNEGSSSDKVNVEANGIVPKTSTLTRLFKKKNRTESASEPSTRRSFFERSLIFPWLAPQQSFMDLSSAPAEGAVIGSDDDSLESVTVTSSQIF